MKERRLALVNTGTGLIENMLVFTDEKTIADMVFPNHILAVEATEFDVTVGNFYDERGFIVDEEPVERIPSEAELLAELSSRLEFTQSVIDELLLSSEGEGAGK